MIDATTSLTQFQATELRPPALQELEFPKTTAGNKADGLNDPISMTSHPDFLWTNIESAECTGLTKEAASCHQHGKEGL